MATSAVCVTGLVVVEDLPSQFTWAGQAVLLALIQVGGLGFSTFSTLIVASLGRRLSFGHEALVEVRDEGVMTAIDLRRLSLDVVLFTLVLEAIGAAVLYGLWAPWNPNRPIQSDWAETAWHAIFHSVSAFCNAGFSTFPDSAMGLAEHRLSLFVLIALIVVGGIGFLTLEEFKGWLGQAVRGRLIRLSLHFRVVIWTSGLLLIGGWAATAWLEWEVSLAGLNFWDKHLNAAFASVTARTAGFHTIDYTRAVPGTLLATMVLMFIGGSPGSTAGGLKTTTCALLVCVAWSRLRGDPRTTVRGRTIPPETIQRAAGLFVAGIVLAVSSLFVLLATAPTLDGSSPSSSPFLEYAFEVVSALNTVGLSLGATDTLTPVGQSLIIILMFLGRVGLVTTGSALAFQPIPEARQFRCAYENIVVG